MSLVCAQCSRVNPQEAAYCYHDGAALAGRVGGPINAGSAPFPSQFVFPNGLACRNFDQLAMACQQYWTEAIDLLRQGYLGSFFGGMGRVDLAMAAQEAAKYPDLDRGLDQLLAKLPTQAVQAPKLQAEPTEINLGQLAVGADRATELHLSNVGMRLLYGQATSDCNWLALGDAPGHPEKIFQFGADTTIPVQIRGQNLRAGAKPLEGHIVLDSNGGTVSITIRADVPITPYDGGMFAGAVTPRQIAEKAKSNPKDAASYFEKGDVASWYRANGWSYPVVGPIMPGMGAIQQFFEALGVAKAPAVEVTPKQLDVSGAVGKTIECSIEVTEVAGKDKRKFVYGWATGDKPWIEIGATRLAGGKSATIPILLHIPSPCPPTLEGVIHVVGNGNQKIDIPLKVTVEGGQEGVVLRPEQAEFASLEFVDETEEAPVSLQVVEEAPPPVALAAAIAAPPLPAASPPPPAPPAPPAPLAPALPADSPSGNGAITAEAPRATPAPPIAPPAPPAPPSTPSVPSSALAKRPDRLPLPVRLVIHLLPIVLLSMCLLSLLIRDIFSKAPTGGGAGPDGDGRDIDPRLFVKIKFDEGRAGPNFTDSMTFAVHKVLDPDKPGETQKLNWYENGFGNSTVVKIDGIDATFGIVPDHGIWDKEFRTGAKKAGEYGGEESGRTRTFMFSKGIFVTQTVTLVPSDHVEVKPGEYKRLLNACLVRYEIENRDNLKHNVGLRILMDTCIGDRDDVPFMFPGVEQPVTTSKEFKGSAIPDFVQVLEQASLRQPGTVMQLGLKVGGKYEAPGRFQLTRYPASSANAVDKKKILGRWEVPLVNFGDDSSVAIYWEPRELNPKSKREVAFTYGLGTVSADDKLGLTVGGSMYVGGELSVVALIADPNVKSATLTLPKNMELIEPKSLTQNVSPPRQGADGKVRPTNATWRVRATATGSESVSVRLDSGPSQSRRVTVTARSLFN